MKSHRLLLVILVLFLSSCEKDDVAEPNLNDTIYPATLEFNTIDYGNGISTYTMDGLIETPDYFREQMHSFDTAKRFFSNVLIRSQDSAQFTFTEIPNCDEECLNQWNELYKNVGISTRNDTIIFTVDIIYEDIFFTVEFPAIGSLTQELAFTNYTMMSVRYQGNNFSTESLESGLGMKDYTGQIDDLGVGDTLAVMQYQYIFLK
ncbi:MAG: hypothetical protein GQ527_03025 [Bacteroidales bacterium]|nr:hypothetical protein [Bacteroidales bacterium]